MATDKLPQTLQEAIVFFADKQRCHDIMTMLRWPDGVVRCPRCASDKVGFIKTRNLWECHGEHKHAKRQFSVKVGTVMEDSPLGLDKWLITMWLVANCKNGISSYEVKRALWPPNKGSQQTAWFLLQRVRLAMQTRSFRPFAGHIEVDETFIGGKARNMHARRRRAKIQGRGTVGKAVVMGLLERHSRKVRTIVVSDRTAEIVQPIVRKNVMPLSDLYTDEMQSYEGLADRYAHNVINHAEAYVDGQIHTNGMENFWSLLKRAIKGTYVSVEPFHLFRYMDEQTFRFNNRKATDAERFALVANQVVGRRVTYKELTGAAQA
jgi:transposase-like protein